MARVAARSRLTPAEYLAWEREHVDKHEYHAGDVFAIAGGSPRHNWIAGNVQSVLKRRLDDRSFTFTSDQRIAFDDGRRYVYPDVSIVCGPIILQDGAADVVVNPTILIEVLSSTTEQYDRGLKWEGYQRLSSLTDYVLVAQHEVRIEHFLRAPDRGLARGLDRGWFYQAYGAGEAFTLGNGAQLDVDAIYARAFELPGD
jgi:Uma2 family endonuclease